jgi:hypothetical protein
VSDDGRFTKYGRDRIPSLAEMRRQLEAEWDVCGTDERAPVDETDAAGNENAPKTSEKPPVPSLRTPPEGFRKP